MPQYGPEPPCPGGPSQDNCQAGDRPGHFVDKAAGAGPAGKAAAAPVDRAVSVPFGRRVGSRTGCHLAGTATVSVAFGRLGIPAGLAVPGREDIADPSDPAAAYGVRYRPKPEVVADSWDRPAVAPVLGWRRQGQERQKTRD